MTPVNTNRLAILLCVASAWVDPAHDDAQPVDTLHVLTSHLPRYFDYARRRSYFWVRQQPERVILFDEPLARTRRIALQGVPPGEVRKSLARLLDTALEIDPDAEQLHRAASRLSGELAAAGMVYRVRMVIIEDRALEEECGVICTSHLTVYRVERRKRFASAGAETTVTYLRRVDDWPWVDPVGPLSDQLDGGPAVLTDRVASHVLQRSLRAVLSDQTCGLRLKLTPEERLRVGQLCALRISQEISRHLGDTCTAKALQVTAKLSHRMQWAREMSSVAMFFRKPWTPGTDAVTSAEDRQRLEQVIPSEILFPLDYADAQLRPDRALAQRMADLLVSTFTDQIALQAAQRWMIGKDPPVPAILQVLIPLEYIDIVQPVSTELWAKLTTMAEDPGLPTLGLLELLQDLKFARQWNHSRWTSSVAILQGMCDMKLFERHNTFEVLLDHNVARCIEKILAEKNMGRINEQVEALRRELFETTL